MKQIRFLCVVSLVALFVALMTIFYCLIHVASRITPLPIVDFVLKYVFIGFILAFIASLFALLLEERIYEGAA
ncbi:MAG: hypothetical protein DRH17_13670 [Deltaproteobacteria bacterium]|nr:MAG: hypothetical protein DRH17_13670 [Deltaproteobacteria bacterium]